MDITKREVFAEVSPRTDYYLADIGYSLKPILESLFLWSLDYTNTVKSSGKD
ncbi:MAG: winged helix-turn-helix transcriptional regulator [Erysipelotrichaceae bacterium]|nr:winged helix-turn-helix transcriptional regulator [Erysipelotrichaceae bacterium]